MPFIGLDWRSPGESWIKTHNGSWERLKILENSTGFSGSGSDSACSSLSSSPASVASSYAAAYMTARNRHSLSESSKENSPPLLTQQRTVSESSADFSGSSFSSAASVEAIMMESESTPPPSPPLVVPLMANYQPFCVIFSRPTRERRAHVSLSEAFWRLDFPGAVRDVRRFNYVCKVLDVLISEKLSSLGGQAQKLLFNTLDHVVGQVVSSQQNMHIIRMLMLDLNEAMEESKMIWGKQLGSSALWEGHRQRLQEWNLIMKNFDVQQREDDGKAMLSELPEECLRLILLCLSDHHDLVRSKEALSVNSDGSAKFGQIFNEQRLWRELCFFHFKPQQLKEILKHQPKTASAKEDWELIYQRMKRYFGLKETYAETLHLCMHCRTLFWQPYGHPCPVILTATEPYPDGNLQPRHFTKKAPIPISPRAFLDFFSL
ncbi:putative F-box only protein 25 [Hypsibius exemplaris]|uniref:F-box only protein 25 n=1 Tax=Hypsibius exemplaris TaxID=2072580 RepID=A0A1W0WXY2_HYPEX|nr:putative F-box only protein 25 [Hypsibius exemplaris]